MQNGKNDKKRQYCKLVLDQITCPSRCAGLTNAIDIETEHSDDLDELSEIGAWSRWQGNLDARIMIVAQDWGSKKTYIDQGGRDKISKRSVTNGNIIELMRSIDEELDDPEVLDQPNLHFFTNACLCYRVDNKEQGGAKTEWFSNCRKFLMKQIEIVQPRVVIALGKVPFDNIMKAFKPDFQYESYQKIVDDHTHIPIMMDKTYVVPVFHCGAFGVNKNRKSPIGNPDKLFQHKEDWKIIKQLLER